MSRAGNGHESKNWPADKKPMDTDRLKFQATWLGAPFDKI